MSADLVNIVYLIAASLFVLGLKGLSHPRTAVRGNMLGALGMFIAVVVTLINQQIIGFEAIVGGLILGGVIGGIWAVKVPMTGMPQFVGLCNGFGGGASVLVAGAAFVEASLQAGTNAVPVQFSIATVASGMIGSVTFWGSLIAFGITGPCIREGCSLSCRSLFKSPYAPGQPGGRCDDSDEPGRYGILLDYDCDRVNSGHSARGSYRWCGYAGGRGPA